MIVGVTGARKGPTAAQKTVLDMLLRVLAADGFNATKLVHGGAVGVDLYAAETAASVGFDLDERAGSPGSYLARNREIVAAADLLIGVPSYRFDLDGEWVSGDGGTKYTMLHAVGEGVPVVAVWPDGLVAGAWWVFAALDPDVEGWIDEVAIWRLSDDQTKGETPAMTRVGGEFKPYRVHLVSGGTKWGLVTVVAEFDDKIVIDDGTKRHTIARSDICVMAHMPDDADDNE